ncbi:dTDP-4-dehydrorhamnose reductase [Betaproteobacteria bacterium MOLA814]|nr:dTDP-4-dehydrorhamnose reductase [Betaproteobacteria bacterium MOLA814]
MTHKIIKVLVLGATGMLGNAVLRLFAQSSGYEAFGSARSTSALRLLPADLSDRVICGVDVEHIDSLINLFSKVQPNIVINCVGLVKQLAEADDPLVAISINSLLPHRLARLCGIAGARLVHMSTDCVFSGLKGMYTEADMSDAKDLYGRSKYLGEVSYPHAITLRTSIIGHELNGGHSLVEWFLAQQGSVKGFRRAIFSGLPTIELARVIRDHVIPLPELHGVHHVSAAPINKFDLLTLISDVYEKKIDVVIDDSFVIDRSLDSTRFRVATGYQPRPWSELVREMCDLA